MDLLTRTELVDLAQSRSQGPRVSLYMPTHRFGEGVQGDPLRWKNLVTGVENALAERLGAREASALLAPARELQGDGNAWQYMSDGLVMLLRAGEHHVYRVPAPLPELASVGDRWIVGPLLRLLSGDGHFLLLGLSQGEVRLLEGSRHTVEQVQLADVPTSLREFVRPPEDRPAPMARPSSTASRGGPAVFYGHGATDDRAKEEDVRRFLREVSSGLREALPSMSSPMVLVGLNPLASIYRDVSTYDRLVPEAVVHNPEQLSAEELHAKVWPLIERRLREERGQAMERFHALQGTGRTSHDLGEVAEAAAHGRVETLFVTADPWCWEKVAKDSTAVVALGQDDAYMDCERVDTAATDTMINSGQVYVTTQQVAPEGDVAAIFRY